MTGDGTEAERLHNAEAADTPPIGEWVMQPSGNLAALFHHGMLQLILRRHKDADGTISWRPEVHGSINNYAGEPVPTADEAQRAVIDLLVEVLGKMAGDAARA